MPRMEGFLIVINPGEDAEVELNPTDYRATGLEFAIGEAVLKAMEAAEGDAEVVVASFAQ